MKFKSIPIIALITLKFIIAQPEELDIDNTTSNGSLQGAFGAVTIDGKIWNQIALRPILPFGKLSIKVNAPASLATFLIVSLHELFP